MADLIKHFNLVYSGTTPLNLGDRYFVQDLIRDLLYSWGLAGEICKRTLGTYPALLFGGIVTKGAGDTLNITACYGICDYNVEIPDTFASLPPSKTTVTVPKKVYAPAQTNMALAAATLDGSTENYIKLKYTEVDGNSRTRARSAGTYAYERTESYTYVVSSTAPTAYDVVLGVLIGTAGGAFVIYQNSPISVLNTIPYGYVNGMTLSNAADTDHDITVAIGYCKDSTNAYVLYNPAAFTKRIDGNWAKGTGSGGLDTGAVGASTEYFVWAIREDTSGVIDFLFSASSTAPTMPAGYTYKRLLRGVRTDSSSNIVNNQWLITDVTYDREAILSVRDQKAQNTAGGTFTAGAWRTRDLNTILINEIPGASLASNQITLPSGHYSIVASAPSISPTLVQAKLYNVTGGVNLVIGETGYAPVTAVHEGMTSTVIGSFYLASASVVELQHQCGATSATFGFGYNANYTTEVYTQVLITKRG